MSAQDAAPGEFGGNPARQDRKRNADSLAGRPRLRKRRCIDCNRWHRPLTASARRCGACGARYMARNAFMRALRV